MFASLIRCKKKQAR